jgi:hypothetical protein
MHAEAERMRAAKEREAARTRATEAERLHLEDQATHAAAAAQEHEAATVVDDSSMFATNDDDDWSLPSNGDPQQSLVLLSSHSRTQGCRHHQSARSSCCYAEDSECCPYHPQHRLSKLHQLTLPDAARPWEVLSAMP